MIHARPPLATAAKALFVAAPLAVLAACASMADAEPEADDLAISTERSCFFTRTIRGYSEAPDGPGGSERIYVDTGPSERHVMETFGACPQLDWNTSIAIDTRPSAAPSVCTGDTVTILVPRSIGGQPDRCTARVIGTVIEPS